MTAPSIVVLGSLNMDLVVRAPRLPEPGQTVLGRSLAWHPGGKGANQAVAAARLGAAVSMIGRVGADEHGRMLRETLDRHGVNVADVTTDDRIATAVAVITVDDGGENTIVVTPGANDGLRPALVTRSADRIASASVLVTQLEVPLETVAHAIRLARERGTAVLLNAAPATPDAARLLATIDVLVVNAGEARSLVATGDDPAGLARALAAEGPSLVVVTLGADGCLVAHEGVVTSHPAYAVDAVDTTAAGDAFVGALAVGLASATGSGPEHWRRSIELASAAGALAATRHGAQPSLPDRREVERFLAL